jgi:DNA replication protein DnaC
LTKHPDIQHLQQSDQDKKDLIEYANNPLGFLLLSGTNGSGKSYAAEAIYNANTPMRLPSYISDRAIFITQYELIEECQKEFSLYHNKSSLAEKHRETRLLVLDDIGVCKRRPSDFFLDFLIGLIDHRWRYRGVLGTIITTNLNSIEMREIFGDSFVSRAASGIIKRWDHKDRRFHGF